MKTKFIIISLLILFLSSCCNPDDITIPEISKMEGVWINTDSFVLNFIEFNSDGIAKFGAIYQSGNISNSAKYRMFDDKIAFTFLSDASQTETIHNFRKIAKDTIALGNMTDIPENPDLTYIRRDIIIDENTDADTVEIGIKQIYYNRPNDYRLQFDVVSDSRCPIGANCFWEGNGEIEFKLIFEGNYMHEFKLDTKFKRDTLINDIKFSLIELNPYPDLEVPLHKEDYSAKIVLKRQ